MARRIDTYLKDLVSEDKFDFYSVVRDFADSEIAPKVLGWERDHVLVPDRQHGQIEHFFPVCHETRLLAVHEPQVRQIARVGV